jgi:hypothetical protein
MPTTLPGVEIQVRAEALIVPGPVSVGTIGIVGTGKAQFGPSTNPTPAPPANEPRTLSSFADAQAVFGDYDPFDPDPMQQDGQSLLRALELAYAHGASRVVAVRAADGLDLDTSYIAALDALEMEDVQIVVAAGRDERFAATLASHFQATSQDPNRRERIGVLGTRPLTDSKPPDLSDIPINDEGRMIFVTPGVKTTDRKSGLEVTLPGSYAAAAVAGMLAARNPHVSLTNKTLSVRGLEARFNPGQLEELVGGGYLALEERRGFRIVKGITTGNPAWRQITTRRIVDFARIGVRSAAEPYIGLLNNDRVRKALAGSINGFLAGMVDDEMLISYDLAVNADRDEEIRGIARVTLTLQPTFSIDFIRVVMFLG